MRNFDWKSLLRREGGSVLMILCGLILTVKPDTASALISALAGWVLIAVGAAALIAGFVGGFRAGSVATGAVLLVAGSWLRRDPLMIASVVGFALGLLVLSQGWQAMKDAQRMKRGGGFWVPGAVLAVVELLVGIRLILSPLSVSRVMFAVAGIVMVLCGACNLAGHRKRTGAASGGIIDADE